MTKTKMTAGELYQLAQAQTLIDLYANGTPTEKELAKHYTKDGKIIPTAEAYEKIDYATDIVRRGSITLMTVGIPTIATTCSDRLRPVWRGR